MQAIFFDLFGTLVPNLPIDRWQSAAEEMARHLDLDPVSFSNAWGHFFRQRMEGEIPDGEGQFEAVLEALQHTPPSGSTVSAAGVHRELLRSAIIPRPGTTELLDQLLARGFQLALITDCSTLAPTILDETPLGKYFPVRSCSAHLGVRKPHPKMYQHALEKLQIDGSSCVYVGDGNSEELPGAKQQGMTTVWFDNGEEQHWQERFVPEGDHTITHLGELLLVLDQILSRK
ncbi:MAG TPA: HAD family hydrolase [Planctomycetes bacterium]|nr:HAD family hydrolase [Planctomycetota bacterium]HIN81048.1 HAD family hydrolase [Planctomycetota bacterium]